MIEDDDKQQRRLERYRRFRQDQLDNDLALMMSTPGGRRIMYELLAACRLYQLSYANDDRATAFNEGKRQVGLQYLADVQRVCPEQYSVMMTEHNEFQKRIEQMVSEDQSDGG